MENLERAYRLLVVDDNPAIYQDFVKILIPQGEKNEKDQQLLSTLFGMQHKKLNPIKYTIDDARQGADALKLVEESVAKENPYAVAFVDILMPPGWDGVETTKHIWQVDPDIQIVFCTAYGDYAWYEMITELGINDNFLILKKPFDAIEIKQLACCLSQKWHLNKKIGHQFDRLQEDLVKKSADMDSWT